MFQKKIPTSLIIIFLLFCVSILSYWEAVQDKNYSDLPISDDRGLNKFQGSDENSSSIQKGIFYNIFKSRDQRLSFRYKKSWICKEVAWGERIDCYPDVRWPEEDPEIGFDQVTVHVPNISLHIKNCAATNIPTIDDVEFKNHSYYFIKKYQSCNVLILAQDGNITDEKQLDRIIFPDNKSEDEIKSEEKESKEALIKIKSEKKWFTFKDDEYGFSINYPVIIDERQVGIIKQKCGKSSDQMSSSKQCGSFFIHTLDRNDEEFGMTLKIALNIQNDEDLIEFIRQEYGRYCVLDRIDELKENNLHEVHITPDNYCFMNKSIVKYSPTQKKAIVFDMDYVPLFVEPTKIPVGEYIHYTNEVIESLSLD